MIGDNHQQTGILQNMQKYNTVDTVFLTHQIFTGLGHCIDNPMLSYTDISRHDKQMIMVCRLSSI